MWQSPEPQPESNVTLAAESKGPQSNKDVAAPYRAVSKLKILAVCVAELQAAAILLGIRWKYDLTYWLESLTPSVTLYPKFS